MRKLVAWCVVVEFRGRRRRWRRRLAVNEICHSSEIQTWWWSIMTKSIIEYTYILPSIINYPDTIIDYVSNFIHIIDYILPMINYLCRCSYLALEWCLFPCFEVADGDLHYDMQEFVPEFHVVWLVVESVGFLEILQCFWIAMWIRVCGLGWAFIVLVCVMDWSCVYLVSIGTWFWCCWCCLSVLSLLLCC